MFTLFKRPFYVLSNKLRRQRQPIEWMKEKWIADFSHPEKSCFIIKPEISFNANLEKGPHSKNALSLGLKKKNCMAWLETENRVYVDQVIEAHFRFDSLGGYCAAGIMFRIADAGTYYLALVSSKGYFRLDAVNNNIPQTLIGWTEIPGFTECEANLKMIAVSDHLIFILNGIWIAEANDSSIPGGHLGFALVSYDSPGDYSPNCPQENEYSCQAWLDFLSVDSRARTVRAEYKKWNNSAEISAESRIRLAESLAALDCFEAAYNQILRIWKQREELAKSVMITCSELRSRKELLLAARMASRLKRYETAEEYINECLAIATGSSPIQAGVEERDILAEKAKILSAQNKYGELAVFLPEYITLMKAESDHTGTASLYALLGHACWNLEKYDEAGAAWDTAFSLDRDKGLYAANAANAFEMTDNKDKALQRCLDGARCFLRQNDYAELGALVPQLLALGKDNWEAHQLAGKWAAGIGNIAQSKTELSLAKDLKRAAQTKTLGETKAKPAVGKQSPMAETLETVAKAADKSKKKPTAQKTAAKPKTKTSVPVKETKAKPTVKAKAAAVQKTPIKKRSPAAETLEATGKSKAKPTAKTQTKPGMVTATKTATKPKAKISVPAKETKVKAKATAQPLKAVGKAVDKSKAKSGNKLALKAKLDPQI